VSLPQCAFGSFPSLRPFVPLWPQLPLVGFDGAKDEKLLPVLHEIVEKDMGLELSLEGFRSLPPIDTGDVEVIPLHVIFDLQGVFVGRNNLEFITCCLCHIT